MNIDANFWKYQIAAQAAIMPDAYQTRCIIRHETYDEPNLDNTMQNTHIINGINHKT